MATKQTFSESPPAPRPLSLAQELPSDARWFLRSQCAPQNILFLFLYFVHFVCHDRCKPWINYRQRPKSLEGHIVNLAMQGTPLNILFLCLHFVYYYRRIPWINYKQRQKDLEGHIVTFAMCSSRNSLSLRGISWQSQCAPSGVFFLCLHFVCHDQCFPSKRVDFQNHDAPL